jgi:hypothetical protein
MVPIKTSQFGYVAILEQDEDIQQFMLCSNCWTSVKQGKVPTLNKSNGFTYSLKPTNLPPLDPLSEHLISPQLPFMQIRHLHYEGKYSIVGQVNTVPCDVDEVVKQLPRHLDDDQAINVNSQIGILERLR